MDYTLTSLRDAFDDAKYKESRRDFRLYAILLATSLDQRFILEYLSFFHELDTLTGKRLLVIGPKLVNPSGRRRSSTNTEIWASDLGVIRDLVTHNSEVNSLSWRDPTEAAGRFLQFMHDQTRESYAIARFLGVRSDQLPAFVFFDNLDFPQHFIVWNLQGKTGRDFVLELRRLLEDVGERCHWQLKERIPELQRQVEEYRKEYLWDQGLPRELRKEWEYSMQKHKELRLVNEAVQFYERLEALRSAYDRACGNSSLRLPLENIGHTIARLEAGQVDRNAFTHFDRHLRRWKTRMPLDYRAALESFSYPSNVVEKGMIRWSRSEATVEYRRLEHEVRQSEEAYKQKKATLTAEAEQALESAQRIVSRPGQPELIVVRDILNISSSKSEGRSRVLDIGELIGGRVDIPRVFISYSHDSDQHKARVLELAQRLRGDGVDCWIDQFEENPPQGFPRWMQQQIAEADIVLIICTKIYRIRFDGLEELGRGQGSNFEGYLILQQLYDSSMLNRKFVPVLLPGATSGDIPTVLRGSTWYEIPSSYSSLKRRIFEIPSVAPRSLGEGKDAEWSF